MFYIHQLVYTMYILGYIPTRLSFAVVTYAANELFKIYKLCLSIDNISFST